MCRIRTLLFIVCLIVFGNYVSAQTEGISYLKVVSKWEGLGTPASDKLTIKQKKGKFYGNGRLIKTELIEAVIRALDVPEEQLSLKDFGITQDWLNLNAEKVLPNRVHSSFENEKALFLKSFRDIKLVERVFPKVIGGWWTDDFPYFEIEITYIKGKKIKAYSSEQTIFMLPWKIVSEDNTYYNSNPRLSFAIANILPEKFINKGRIDGRSLANRLAEKISDEIREEMLYLETRNRLGPELDRLKDRYTLQKTAINLIHSIDVGPPTNSYQTGDYKKWSYSSWNAELTRNDLPSNVMIGLSLPYKQNRLENFDLFLEKIDELVEHVLSVPWLNEQITDNPDKEFEIRFVEDRSLSKKAHEGFLEDLGVFGPNAVSEEILNGLERAVFVQVSEKFPSRWSRWLILPNKNAVLWQIRGESVFKWKPSDFDTRNLYDTNDWYQTKAIIAPDGIIVSK